MALRPHLGYANLRISAGLFWVISRFTLEGAGHLETEQKTWGDFSGGGVCHVSKQFQGSLSKKPLLRGHRRQVSLAFEAGPTTQSGQAEGSNSHDWDGAVLPPCCLSDFPPPPHLSQGYRPPEGQRVKLCCTG